MRVFLAYSFTDLINPQTGLVDEGSKKVLENFIYSIEEMGHSVFSAHAREKWGGELYTHLQATKADLQEMRNADLVIAFPGSFPISGGVHVELGWASALKKSIVLFLDEKQRYSPLVMGLEAITQAEIVYFEEVNCELFKEISTRIKKYELLEKEIS